MSTTYHKIWGTISTGNVISTIRSDGLVVHLLGR